MGERSGQMPQIKTLQKKFDHIKNCNASREGIAACHNLSQKKLVYPSKTQKKSGKKRRRESKKALLIHFSLFILFYFILMIKNVKNLSIWKNV